MQTTSMYGPVSINVYCMCTSSTGSTVIGLRFLPHTRATEMWIITVAPEAMVQRETHTKAEIIIPSFCARCWVE